MDPAEKKVCSICFRDYTGWGNNAEPVNHGRCCDECNQLVIAARLQHLFRNYKAPEEDKGETV